MNSNDQPEPNQQLEKDEKIGKPLFAAGLKEVGQLLDACFLPLGFEQTKGVGTRQYVKEDNGRFLTAIFAVRTRNKYITGDISYKKYAGMSMDIEVSTSIKTRLSTMKSPGLEAKLVKFAQKLRKSYPVTDLPTPYDSCITWANDPEWGRQFLSTPAVIDAITPLLLAENLPVTSLNLSPNKWLYTRPVVPTAMSSQAVERWIEELTAVVILAEKNSPPNEVDPNWLEKQSSTTSTLIIAVGILFGIPFLLFVCCMLPAFILILLTQL